MLPACLHGLDWDTFTVTKYYLGDHIKKDKIGGACGTLVEDKECTEGSSGET
jgi:hypothetical protein